MDVPRLKELLTAVARKETTIDEALRRLAILPFETVDFATLDHHRQLRCGHPEVIFCQGKTVEQVLGIARRLAEGGGSVLATRTSPEQRDALVKAFPQAMVNELGRVALLNQISNSEFQISNSKTH